MSCNHISQPPACSTPKTCMQNKSNLPNYNIRHPSHTHTEYQHCLRLPQCPKVLAEVHTCDHGPYIPKTSPYPKPICHPDRPAIMELQATTESENKECSKCSDVFSNLDSMWEDHLPTRREEDQLEECRNLSEIECNMPMECCCRCCTCRGCPTCGTQNCHPCHFFPLVKNCCAPPQATMGRHGDGPSYREHHCG